MMNLQRGAVREHCPYVQLARGLSQGIQSKMMHLALEMMDCLLKMMDFALK